MTTELHVLILEDNSLDAELEAAALEAAGYACRWQRVETRDEFLARLHSSHYDLILADYTLPSFDGLTALRLLRSEGVDIPFILISGKVGEELAIESLKAGATDYVMKSRPARLAPVVRRALYEHALQRQRQRAEEELAASEARYRELFENANDILYTLDIEGNFASVNRAMEHLTGYTRAELCAMNIAQLVVPEQLERVRQMTMRQIAGEVSGVYELDILSKDGRPIVVEVGSRSICEGSTPVGVHCIARDVTERKLAAEEKAALLDVAREISGTLDLNDLLECVQRRTAKMLRSDAVATLSWHPVQETFSVIAHWGTPAGALPQTKLLEAQVRSAYGRRLLDGETVTVNASRTAVDATDRLCTLGGISALIAAPLQVRGRPLGALVALRAATDRPFEPREVDLCTGVAGQLAVALEAAELYQAQQDEARVAGALARVAKGLISSLATPLLLERLCQLTAQELRCDVSHTFLWQEEEDAYVPVADCGEPADQGAALRLLKIPRPAVVNLLDRLDRDAVVRADMTEAGGLPLAAVARKSGMAAALFVALKRGGEIIGILAAGYRGRHQSFGPQQERILQGIAQLGSMALENARLLTQLGHANRLKSDFLATMSHELRTPLNIIIGYGDLLMEGVFGPLTPDQADTLRRLEKSSHALLELITATLDVSRLDTGHTLLNVQEIDVPRLLDELDAENRHWHEKPHLRLLWNIPGELPQLRTDAMKLKMALKNLIANAVKFSDKGCVTISVGVRDAGVEFSVADSGTGIAPEALPTIFEPFRQADSSATRQFGGVGLGLYIVRRLLELLGGTIVVNSELGRGSTFRLWLPRVAKGGVHKPHGSSHKTLPWGAPQSMVGDYACGKELARE